MRLRAVIARGAINGDHNGWWDRLECGHLVRYDGQDRARRQCRDCTDPEVQQDRLFE